MKTRATDHLQSQKMWFYIIKKKCVHHVHVFSTNSTVLYSLLFSL